MSSPKRQGLSKKEQEARWEQYRASKTTGRPRVNYTRNTKFRTRQVAGHLEGYLKLSHCATDYANALVMPFSLHKPACIPDLHGIPSKKIRVVNRGVFSTGTGGYGHIGMFPWCGSNNAADVIYSQNNFALGETIVRSGVGIGSTVNAKLPYPGSSWASTTTGGIRHRIVGAGLRIRYIGPESSRSGQIVGFRESDNEDTDGLTYDRMRQLETAETFRNSESWHYVMYRPVNPSEYEYSPNSCAPSDVGITSGTSYITQGFVITGTTDINGSPSPAPFEWETVRFIEYIGNIQSITRTHVDVQGMSHVRNGLPVKSTTANPINYVTHAARGIAKSLEETAPAIGAGALGYHILSKTPPSLPVTAASEAEMTEASVPLLEYLPQGVSEGAGFLGEFAEGLETLAPLAMALL